MKRMIGAAAIVLVLAPAPAGAHEVSRRDGNEPEIKVDIKRVVYAHGEGRTRLKTTTYDPLERRHLTHGQIGWALDTKGDAGPDYQVSSRDFIDDKIYCEIHTIPDGDFVLRRRAVVGEDFIRCRFSTKRVDGIAEHFSSYATYGQQGQTDDAPDMFQYRHGS
jgi:hypothetical protein